jgi:hypothetical protein
LELVRFECFGRWIESERGIGIGIGRVKKKLTGELVLGGFEVGRVAVEVLAAAVLDAYLFGAGGGAWWAGLGFGEEVL